MIYRHVNEMVSVIELCLQNLGGVDVRISTGPESKVIQQLNLKYTPQTSGIELFENAY